MPPPPPPQQVQMAPERLKPTDRDQNLIILDTSGGQDTSTCRLWGHSSHGFSRNTQKPHFWPVSFSQNSVKMSKIIRPKLRSNRYCKWSGYIGMPNCKSFFPCVLKKMPGNLSGLICWPNLSSGIRWCLALAIGRPQWCLLWRFWCVCMCVCRVNGGLDLVCVMEACLIRVICVDCGI